jgi:hypothetical protein
MYFGCRGESKFSFRMFPNAIISAYSGQTRDRRA